MEAFEPANEAWSVQRLVSGLGSPTRWQRRLLKRRFHAAGLRPHTLPLTSGHLHVWSGGTGEETLILLHGFGGSCLWQWAEMVGDLAKRYRLLVPDLLWFGKSDGDQTERTLEAQAQTIRTLIQKTSNEPVHLAGISYGGFVSYLVANDHPDLVQSLTLINCPASVMTKDDYQAILSHYQLTDMSSMLVPDSPEGLPRLMQLAYHRPPTIPRFVLADAYRTLFGGHCEQRRALLTDLVDYLDNPREHGKSEHPALIIWGEFDELFPADLGRRLQRQLGGRAEFTLIEKTAHAPILENPKAVIQKLVEFLDKNAPS